MAFFTWKNILLLDNFWDTKSLCKLRRDFFPVIVLRVYKHFFNMSEMIDSLIFPEMMRSLAKQIFSSCTQFEGRLPLEWTEFFTCSKKLGESITPSQSRNISPLLCPWAGMWSHLGQCSASLLQLGPLHRVYPLHLCRLNSCLQIQDQIFCKDNGEHRRRKETYVLFLRSLGDVA